MLCFQKNSLLILNSFQTMSCVVPGCRSGYGTKNKFPPGIGKHRFPQKQELREAWIKAIPRSGWSPSSHAVVCSLHFEESDFRLKRTDTNKHRQRGELKTRRLKTSAVPRLFPGCPAYLSKPKVPQRSEKASSSCRRQVLIDQAEEEAKSFLVSDVVSSFQELSSSPPKDFPSTWSVITLNNIHQKLVFEDVALDVDGKAFFKFSLVIHDDLSFKMVLRDVPVPNWRVSHISPEKVIQRTSDISNILAFLNGAYEDVSSLRDPIQDSIDILLKFCQDAGPARPELARKIEFITEQLRLSKASKFGRKYSTKFILTTLQWMKTSPALYRLMLDEDLLTLPSLSYLQRLSSSYDLETGLTSSSLAYLSERAKHLSEQEKNVAILIDEVKINLASAGICNHLSS